MVRDRKIIYARHSVCVHIHKLVILIKEIIQQTSFLSSNKISFEQPTYSRLKGKQHVEPMELRFLKHFSSTADSIKNRK